MIYRPWTEDDLRILIEDSLAGIPRTVTAAVLQRTADAVRTKAHEQHIKQTRRIGRDKLRDRWLALMPALKQSLLSDIATHG